MTKQSDKSEPTPDVESDEKSEEVEPEPNGGWIVYKDDDGKIVRISRNEYHNQER